MHRSAWLPLGPVDSAVALVDAVASDIRRGRLASGERLPGTRALAQALGVNRKTVAAAFAELEAEGWISLREGSGAFVSGAIPGGFVPAGGATVAHNAPASPGKIRAPVAGPRTISRVHFSLPPIVETGKEVSWPTARMLGRAKPSPEMIVMAGGQPDLRVLPLDSLARAWRRALSGTGRSLVDYSDTHGEPTLLSALSDWLAETRGVRPDENGLVVTRGSQGALYLIARSILRAGDRVAVERFGYGPAWAVFRQAGMNLVPVEVDSGGLNIDGLSAESNVRAVYLTPHHQYPTGVVLAPGRRDQLLKLAAERNILVIEDDYDHEFHYVGRPVLPLAASDTRGVVIYVGTLSKALAPGLRVGFVAASPEIVTRLAAYRRLVDRQGDHVTERAVAELILDGSLGRHIRRSRRTYFRRRNTLLAGLSSAFRADLIPNDPPGGMALWVSAPGIDVDAWAARGRAHGVEFTTAREYAFDGKPEPFIRLGFACLDESEIVEAVRRMRAAV